MTTCYDSIDPLYNNAFSFTLNRKSSNPDAQTDTLDLMVQQINLPGVGISDQPQPTIFGTTIPIPTLGISFEALNVEFIVDSNFSNWRYLYSWMRQISNIDNDYDNNLEYNNWHISTGTLKIYKPTTRYPTQQTTGCTAGDLILSTIQFENLIPVSLSGLRFQSDSTDLIIQKATCKFKYSYYTISPMPADVVPVSPPQ